jgi:hypothetical protein
VAAYVRLIAHKSPSLPDAVAWDCALQRVGHGAAPLGMSA